MSLRWIHENLEAPTCEEECSDIDDSCSDDSYDTDLSLHEDERSKEDSRGEQQKNCVTREKRETRKHPTTTVNFDENGVPKCAVSRPYERIPSCLLWDPRKQVENQVYNFVTIKLYCRTGYHMTITPTGKIRGLSDPNESYALLHVFPMSYGIVRIQGVESRLYLAFNKKGHLYGEVNMNKENTEWEQWSIGTYDAFRSRKFAEYDWWLGIKKNGRGKAGPRTSWGQKAIQFLAIRQD